MTFKRQGKHSYRAYKIESKNENEIQGRKQQQQRKIKAGIKPINMQITRLQQLQQG